MAKQLSMSLSTPVVFIIFNRPNVTKQVFDAISQAQPKRLLIVADGPRHSSDVGLCDQARAITELIDWDCEVIRNYSKINLGCKKRVSSGLDWAFSQVDEAIILEDDCLPSNSFFPYCEALLAKYKYDTRIMHVGGHNFLCSNKTSPSSYYFSGLTQVWGWATWKRAWDFYDVNMAQWPLAEKRYPSIFERFGSQEVIDCRRELWEKTYRGLINSWDYQWLFAVCSQNGLCILPKINMISNIGFGEGATHTVTHDLSRENLQRGELLFPLVHPSLVLRDQEADNKYLTLGSAKKKSFKVRLASLFRSQKALLLQP